MYLLIAVRIVHRTGPIAMDGTTASPGDLYGQSKRCIEIIKKAIEDAGGHVENVLRTRAYLTDISTDDRRPKPMASDEQL